MKVKKTTNNFKKGHQAVYNFYLPSCWGNFSKAEKSASVQLNEPLLVFDNQITSTG